MIDTTAALLRRQGYHATGLNQIVREAKAPKGSLYFHFPGGKEALAQAALARSGQQVRQELLAVVARHACPADALLGVIDYFAGDLEATGFMMGCPIATVALEAAATSDPLQAVCSQHYAHWQSELAAYLEQHGLPEQEACEFATTVLAAFEGALLLSRAHRDVASLRAVGQQLSQWVRAKLPRE